MRKEIALALIVVALVGGFLLGRGFPAHHYVPRGFLLLDEATGKICNPMKTFQEKAADAKDPFAKYGGFAEQSSRLLRRSNCVSSPKGIPS